jgi:hypothetical protein
VILVLGEVGVYCLFAVMHDHEIVIPPGTPTIIHVPKEPKPILQIPKKIARASKVEPTIPCEVCGTEYPPAELQTTQHSKHQLCKTCMEKLGQT